MRPLFENNGWTNDLPSRHSSRRLGAQFFVLSAFTKWRRYGAESSWLGEWRSGSVVAVDFCFVVDVVCFVFAAFC